MPRSEVCGSYNFRSASVRRPQPKIRVRIRDRSRLLCVIHCQSASPRPSSITTTLSCNPWAQSSSRGSVPLVSSYMSDCLYSVCLFVCLPAYHFLLLSTSPVSGCRSMAGCCPAPAVCCCSAHCPYYSPLRPALSDSVSVSVQLHCD